MEQNSAALVSSLCNLQSCLVYPYHFFIDFILVFKAVENNAYDCNLIGFRSPVYSLISTFSHSLLLNDI